MRVFRIALGGRAVGTLSEAGSGSLFIFDDGFRNDPDRPMLSQSLIDSAGRPIDRTYDDGIVPFFENVLPEAGPLRRFLASRNGANPNDDLALLDLLGKNLPGNVTAEIAYETDEARAVRERAPRLAPSWRFSLAGVQMKFSGTKANGRWSIATLDEPGDWIVKLGTDERPAIVENEFAMMSFARACGLDVPEIELARIDAIEGLDERLRVGVHAYAIRRFDRASGSRIHQEDFCQILGLRPELKYIEDVPQATAERVASIVRELCGPDAVREWVRRLFFSIAIGNGDAHLKNHAVVYPDGRNPQLSPVYDLLCTLRNAHDDRPALSIGGRTAFNDLDSDALRDFAVGAALSPRIVRSVCAEMAERLAEQWPHARGQVEDHDLRSILDHRIAKAMPKLLG